MKLLWTKDLKLNTVHVSDVARAIWFSSTQKSEKGGRSSHVSSLEVYNLCDKNGTGNLSLYLLIHLLDFHPTLIHTLNIHN